MNCKDCKNYEPKEKSVYEELEAVWETDVYSRLNDYHWLVVDRGRYAEMRTSCGIVIDIRIQKWVAPDGKEFEVLIHPTSKDIIKFIG